ncbi:MAG: histidine--tRNA ligase [Acidimicrobiia bacterium]
MSFQPPKGTDDIGAPQSSVWRSVLGDWEEWSARFGYPLVMTPIFEATDLFQRGVGDTSEVVTKQMYTFTDRGGRSVTLRPEGTAGVVRAFLDSGMKGAWKGAYSGPMFRYERPQGGRRRQFWQVGVEYLDVEAPPSDVEVIELGYRYLGAVGVPGLEVRLNSLGDGVCRPGYVEELRSFLRSRYEELCDESKPLVDTNPLRVLDCKICGPNLTDAPAMADRLCDACSAHFEEVKDTLTRLEVPFVEDHRLVRGLDYYTRTAFEYIATDLETAQNAVGGGGRYDGLAESLGGRRAPGVGFALGVDRIILATEREPGSELDVFVVSEVPAADALVVASRLRLQGVRVDLESEGRSIKAQFRSASRSGAPVTVVLRSLGEALDVRTDDGLRVDMPLEELPGWLKARSG